MSSDAHAKLVDEINDQFAIAREEIESAREDAETVYFNDAVKEARAATDACLTKWNALLASLGEAERMKMQRSIGLKMEQLKAEMAAVEATHS